MKAIRATTMLALMAGGLPAQQPVTVPVKVVHFSPEAVEVWHQGRSLGKTPKTFSLPAGVLRLKIDKADHCIYAGRGEKPELVLAAGKIESLTGALRCEEAWSDLAFQAVPAGVTIKPSEGDAQRRGQGVNVRVPLPGRVTLAISGAPYAPFTPEVLVGPRESLTYRLRLGPAMPRLHADSVFEPRPAEPQVPTAPPMGPEPRDPASALIDSENKLAIVRSARRGDAVANVGAWVFVGAGIAAIITHQSVLKDSLNLQPALRSRYSMTLGVAGAGLGVMLIADGASNRKGVRAGCDEPKSDKGREKCRRDLQRETESLRESKATYPSRKAAYAAERARNDSLQKVALQDFERRRIAWIEQSAAADARNQQRTRNRADNQQWLNAWRERARAAQGLDLIQRKARP